jgi:hypothetical protein
MQPNTLTLCLETGHDESLADSVTLTDASIGVYLWRCDIA